MGLGSRSREWCSTVAAISSRLFIRRAGHASFRDDGADVAGRRDVEGRILDRGVWRSHRSPENVRHLGSGALFDGDLAAGSERQVERGNGGGHEERDMFSLASTATV